MIAANAVLFHDFVDYLRACARDLSVVSPLIPLFYVAERWTQVLSARARPRRQLFIFQSSRRVERERSASLFSGTSGALPFPSASPNYVRHVIHEIRQLSSRVAKC